MLKVFLSRSGSRAARRTLLILLALPLFSGCAFLTYEQTQPGTLNGRLIVEWYGPARFVVKPDDAAPLTFTRANGEVIAPGTLYIDGDSEPRLLWVSKPYAPWGYTPAFVVHDWLQQVHRCRIVGQPDYDYAAAAGVMAEVVKTLMRDPLYGGENRPMLYALYHTFRTPAAARHWDTGACRFTDNALSDDFFNRPIIRYAIEFKGR